MYMEEFYYNKFKKEKKCRNCGSNNIKFIYLYKQEYADGYEGRVVRTDGYYDIYCNDCKYTQREWNDNKINERICRLYEKIEKRAKNIKKIRKRRLKLEKRRK